MKSILLVDDSPTVLMSMESVLTRAGYSVDKAADGRQALTRLQAAVKTDLMITDLNMPNMDGITLIRETRRLTARRFMPILMLTTESQQAKRDEAKSAGATGWLVKPVGAGDLLNVLKQVLPG
jgi:two-component system, chemotaxis family, chemotaxis protein CheY